MTPETERPAVLPALRRKTADDHLRAALHELRAARHELDRAGLRADSEEIVGVQAAMRTLTRLRRLRGSEGVRS